VLLLHGFGGSGDIVERYFRLQPIAAERGFLYAHPDGTRNARGEEFWNATDACCGFGSTVDDSGYLEQVIRDIQARYSVDQKRIFVVGHSNGGFMAYRMACDHADTIAAITSLAGSMVNDLAACPPSAPVSVLQIHGTADRTISYGGGTIVGSRFPSAEQSVRDWARVDGCATTPVTDGTRDIATRADSSDPSSRTLPGAETQVSRYRHCRSGSDVELWSINGGGHVPALSGSLGTQLIDFLYAHPKA
jgi:polyhydroxybutyrate depolymerase